MNGAKQVYQNMNLPNKLTCLRMIMVLPFVLFMLIGRAEGAAKVFSLILFIAASFTDYLDGQIARRDGLVTNFGKFMDPLADKLLVVSALICLVDLGRVPTWIVLVIIAREFIISGFRLIASDNGVVIAASMWGKFKTVTQMILIVMLIIDFKTGFMHGLQIFMMVVVVILTIISLIDYLYKNRKVLSMQK